MFSKMLKNNKGESLVIVIIIAAIMLTIGIAVLAYAANNLTDSHRKNDNKNAYYTAKSAIILIDDSIKEGDLGKYIKEDVFNGLKNSGNTSLSKRYELGPDDIKITFDSDRLTNYEIRDVKITLDSRAQATAGIGVNITSASINITNMIVEFKAVYAGESSYALKTKYTYSGWVNVAAGRLTWSNEKWTSEAQKQ